MNPSFPRDEQDFAGTVLPSVATAPPLLASLDATPRYDLGTVAHELQVNRMVLVQWELQLGMPVTGRLTDERDPARRYSERDLVALRWIRDRLISGTPSSEAITRLMAAQRQGPGWSATSVAEDVSTPEASMPYRPRINTQPLGQRAFGPPAQVPRSTRAPDPRPSGPSYGGADFPMGRPSTPLAFADAVESPRLRHTAGPSVDDLRGLAQPLLRAFGALDTRSANSIISHALSFASVEAVCVGLLQPVANHIGDRWAHRQITMPEERFALNYIRGVLFSHFHAAAERPDAALVFVGCGQHELADLNALMLALFWRHAGLRVVYLGQDAGGADLVEQVRLRRPALVALLIAETQRLRSLSRVSRELHALAHPRPIFAYGGAIFARHPELQRRVDGLYLGDDATTATYQVRRLLGLGRPIAPEA